MRSDAADLDRAHDALPPGVRDTPQYVDPALSRAIGRDVAIKLECFNPVRSFKARGAHILLDTVSDGTHLLCASAGVSPLRRTARQAAWSAIYQHRVGVTQMRGDVVAEIVADPVGVTARAGQQVQHAVRVRVPGVFGDRSARLTWQVGRQPEQEPADPSAGLDPGEPTRHRVEQPVGLGLPASRLYPVARGHRLIF